MMLPSDRTSYHRPSIESVIYDVQFTKSSHPTLKKVLTDIYKASESKKFITKFQDCLKVCLLHEEKSSNVELTLDFAAEFAVSFSLDMIEDDVCPLLEGVFQFIFESHNCQIPLVRLRICQLMNRLLDNMGANATVVEETYNKIATSMLVRLKDSMTSVRTQAVYALHRLQAPGEPQCDIIAAFKYHMMHDPCHDVRCAVIQKIAVTKTTVAAVITRLYDIKDTVRKQAYVFINRLNIRQFTIKQRQLILENGLEDRSDLVQDYVIGTLVHNWLKNFNFNFYEFLECIHVEKLPDIGIKLLKAFFEKQDNVVLESKIKEMWIIDRQISYNNLNITSVVFWRALAEYLKPTENSEKFDGVFEQVLPDLTPFCNYIRGYFFPVTPEKPEVSTDGETLQSGSEEDSTIKSQDEASQDSISQATAEDSLADKTKKKESPKDKTNKKSGPNEDVLVHLLQMCKVFDYSDEMGRKALQKLCVDFLESPCITETATVAELAKLLDDVVPNNDTKLNLMAEVITELREPLQADNSESNLDLLIQETENKKKELNSKIKELAAELEIAEEINDNERIEEIKTETEKLSKELRVLDKQSPLELGRNVNNDPEILKKCLTIVVEVMRRGKITKMNSTLYSLVQNFVAPTIKLRVEGNRSTIKNLAFQALGIFCVLDLELAKENYVMFCVNIANEHVGVTCLKCVFDLMYVFDLATFEIDDPDSVTFKKEMEGDGQSKPNLILLLVSLLSSESPEMRKTAIVGLCKMLFAGKLKSPDLVSKLILLWYDPDAEGDPYIRQPLGTFFSMFATTSPHAPYLIQQAFIPTIKHLLFVDVNDSLAEVDVLAVASLMLEFTKPNFNQHTKKDICIHNQIAINICEEILTNDYESVNSVMFFKILFMLELDYSIVTDFNIMNALVLRIAKVIAIDDRILYRLVTKFKTLLEERHESNKTVSTVDNTLPPETSLGSKVISLTSQLLENSRYGRESADDEEVDDDLDELEEEEEEEEDLTTITHSADDLVIPGTPESSDSDSEIFKGFDPLLSKTTKTKNVELSFKGFVEEFDNSVSKASKVKNVEFKRPLVPPAKTPLKRSSRTPMKTSRNTPVKYSQSDDENVEARAVRRPSTPTKTPGKDSASKSANTPRKTPSKVSVSTPPRKKSSKTPGKRLSDSPSSPATRSSVLRTRSGKKRKSD